MAFLSENPVWEEGIRRIEATDPVLGGEVVNPATEQGGAANIANQQIANRLAWLRGVLDGRYTNAEIDDAIAAAVGVLTAAEILTRVKTVDGAGSGLDADLLDGLHASSFWQVSRAPAELAQTGEQVLPSGLILKWGQSVVSQPPGALIPFPEAFPNECYQVQITDLSSTDQVANAQIVSVRSYSSAGFTAFSRNPDDSSPATSIFYHAIGA